MSWSMKVHDVVVPRRPPPATDVARAFNRNRGTCLSSPHLERQVESWMSIHQATVNTMTAAVKLNETLQILRASSNCLRRPRIRPTKRVQFNKFSTQRSLRATSSSSSSSRKHVTVVNDDGRVRWNELSVGEKAARTTQQSFNLAVVIVGIALTVLFYSLLLLYFLITDLCHRAV